MAKTYDVWLTNDQCSFDSAEGFETVEEAIEWASGRGARYGADFSSSDASCLADFVKVTCYGNGSFYKGEDWVEPGRYFNAQQLAEYLRKKL